MEDIDRAFLTHLILNHTLEEMESLLEVDQMTIYKRIKYLLGYGGLKEARINLSDPEILEFYNKGLV